MQPNRPALNRDLVYIRGQVEQADQRTTQVKQASDSRKYHVASCRLTALILLGGSVDRTLTWSAPFDDDQYTIEWAMFDLEGIATITELSRTAAGVTVRITAGLAAVALGSCFMAFGRSL